MADDFDLSGLTGIVTGGSSGIGLCLTEELAAAGAQVIAFSRRGCPADGRAVPPQVTHRTVDVTDEAALQRAIAAVGDERGLDFLINNAGRSIKKPATELSSAEFRQVLELNVTAMFNACKFAFPYLKASPRKGRVINISSMAAHLGFELVVPYCASKAAVLGLTRGLAMEWVSARVTVNSIAPGWFPSELNQKVIDPPRLERIMHRIPMKSFGDPRDLAGMARFLLSARAGYITGRDFAVDGGALSFGI